MVSKIWHLIGLPHWSLLLILTVCSLCFLPCLFSPSHPLNTDQYFKNFNSMWQCACYSARLLFVCEAPAITFMHVLWRLYKSSVVILCYTLLYGMFHSLQWFNIMWPNMEFDSLMKHGFHRFIRKQASCQTLPCLDSEKPLDLYVAWGFLSQSILSWITM